MAVLSTTEAAPHLHQEYKDSHVEGALRDAKKKVAVLASFEDFQSRCEPGTCDVIKFHGTLTHPETIVLTDGRRREVILREVQGELAPKPRGTEGFHWDPVFIPTGETRTIAELPLDEKLRVSAAGQGYAELRQRLRL